MQARKAIRFGKLMAGDLVKFTHDGEINYGKVVDVEVDTDVGHLQIMVSKKSKTLPQGLPITIDRRSILQSYPSDLIDKITPRLSLKHLWKNLVFREVKTVIHGDPLYAEYRSISPTGFERIERFPTLHEARENVDPKYHYNIVVHYADYFGFTTDHSLHKNDVYHDKEIFFSKKCYAELDWSDRPTGDFVTGEHENHTLPPLADSMICGLVEMGEKGFFYRKWFVCSRQFWTLWTMVCDSKNENLKECRKTSSGLLKHNLKTFEQLLKELDTSNYNVGYNFRLSLEEKRHKHYVWNLEKAALFFPDRYQKVARVLFRKSELSDRSGYSFSEEVERDQFQKRLRRQLLWPKRVTF